MNSIVLLVSCLVAVNAASLRPIIGGQDAKADQAPWQAWVQFSGGDLCGASLIGQTAALTAGQCCAERTEPTPYTVQYGGVDRTNLKYTSKVSKVTIHPNYTSFQYGSDLCVLTLTDHVKVGQDVKLLEIAEKAPLNGTKADLTGWGRTDATSEELPKNLQYVQINILNRTECNNIWSKVGLTLAQDQICTDKKNATFCISDGGDALTVDKKLVGVVSFGHAGWPVDTTVWPNVYADATVDRDWIQKQIA